MYVRSNSGNGLALKRQPASGTNGDLVHWRLYAPPDPNDLDLDWTPALSHFNSFTTEVYSHVQPSFSICIEFISPIYI